MLTKRPRKRPHLGPHQYVLRLDNPNRPAPVIHKNLPHLVFYQGQWHLFRNRWKSQFREPRLWAAAISGTTITELKQRLSKARDRYRYGG